MAFIWLFAIILIRFAEVLLNGFAHQFPKDMLKLGGWAILLDFLFWVKCLFWTFALFLILSFLSVRLAKITFGIFISVLVILQLALLLYFNASLVPLGADIYGYSMVEIEQTVGASGGVGVIPVLSILAVIVLLILAFRFIAFKITPPLVLGVTLLVFSLVLAFTRLNGALKPGALSSDFADNLVLNKSEYFFKSSYDHFYPEENEIDIYSDSYSGDYDVKQMKAVSFDFVDETNYPFLHKNNTEDVLSPFFTSSESKPNIVILLVEGLGRAFTNEGAYLGNFTPYLDSISQSGLYWKNFLSEGGRTFAVLPSLTASLPFAKNGFLELDKRMPNHLSLFNILKFNNYHTSFYYGGNASFDNMKRFLQQNQVDEINDESTFPTGSTKLPANNGFSWGYSDKALFSYFLNTRKPEVDAPQLSVVLTVATHDPFLIDEEAKYLNRFEKRMDELSIDENDKKTYRNYKLQYASILYADDAIKYFMESYKSRTDYKNTIFLITGDHRMPEIPMSNKIDRYHVPLIIYSPLIKRTATFSSVSTHFDIAPSLMAYLRNSYQLKMPSLVSWMGDGLDTTRQFQNRHNYPLMQTKTDLTDYIMGVYHLNGNSLFQMNANMGEVPLDDEARKASLKSSFNAFKRKSIRIAEGTKILPDSIYRNYTKPKD